MKTKIAITGASGFIGSQLVKILLSKNIAVIAGIRKADLSLPDWFSSPNLEIIENIDQNEQLRRLVNSSTSLIHLAGLSSIPKSDEAFAKLEEANVDLPRRLVDLALESELKSLINVSSIRVLAGNRSSHILSDLSMPAPSEAYGVSKLRGEQEIARFAGKGRLAISLRPPLVIGDHARGNWHRLQKIAASKLPLPFSTLHNRRNYISTQSLCEALSLLALGDFSDELSGSYCIADQPALSLGDVLGTLRAGMGLKPALFPLPSGLFNLAGRLPPLRTLAASLFGDLEVDGTRFNQTFGFTPSLSIQQAIAQSAAAFKAQNLSPTKNSG